MLFSQILFFYCNIIWTFQEVQELLWIESQEHTTTSVSVVLCVYDDSNAKRHFDVWPLSKTGSLQTTSEFISAQSLHIFAEPFASHFENIPRELLGNTLEERGHCIASLEAHPGERLDDAGLNCQGFGSCEVCNIFCTILPFTDGAEELYPWQNYWEARFVLVITHKKNFNLNCNETENVIWANPHLGSFSSLWADATATFFKTFVKQIQSGRLQGKTIFPSFNNCFGLCHEQGKEE